MDKTCLCISITIFEWVLSGKESLDYIHVTTNNWFNCETMWGEKKSEAWMTDWSVSTCIFFKSVFFSIQNLEKN